MIIIIGTVLTALEDKNGDLIVRAVAPKDYPPELKAKAQSPKFGVCSVLYKIDPQTHKSVGFDCLSDSCSEQCVLNSGSYGGQQYWHCDCEPY